MAKKGRVRTSGAPSRIRGNLVEAIVAAMHDSPGVTVRQNVWLPTVTGAGRPREIDVLIDGTVAGYPIRIPIECKNEKAVVGAERIDAFIGKLQHIGLAPQQAIYVSVNGFTRGAVARAKAVGMRTLVLTGLTTERLESILHEAIHTTVFLWPIVTQWSVQNEIGHDIKAPEELGVYRNASGEIVGSVADLAWRAWIVGKVPDRAGEHVVDLQLPKGWHNVVEGKTSVPERVTVTFNVHAIAIAAKGSAKRHELRDAENQVVSKLQLKATFDASETKPEVFSTEEALAHFLHSGSATVRVSARIRLPRIQWMGAFWPLSVRVATILNDLWAREAKGEHISIDAMSIENPRLTNMWEPVWYSPLLKSILEADVD